MGLTEALSSLSILEQILWIQALASNERDISSSEAQQQITSMTIPTRWIDIFDRTFIKGAKSLFIPRSNPNHIGQGFQMCNARRKYELTLEGYWVDKYASTSITSEFLREVIGRIEKAVFNKTNQSQTISDLKGRDDFYLSTIQSVEAKGPAGMDTFTPSSLDIGVEIQFFIRVVERLRIQEQKKLYQIIPLPQFSDNNNLERLKNAIQSNLKSNCDLWLGCPISKMSAAEQQLYKTYLFTLYNQRDSQMLAILKGAIAEDLKVREKNPAAPLTHLVALEGYETAITKKRIFLYFKTGFAALTALAAIYIALKKTSSNSLSFLRKHIFLLSS